jgi:hypothetical protein
MIGRDLDLLSSSTAAALIAAGLLSVVLFPLLASPSFGGHAGETPRGDDIDPAMLRRPTTAFRDLRDQRPPPVR